MAHRLCLLLAIIAWAGWVAGQSPYCSFTPEHTLCINSGLGPTCGSQVVGRGVSAQDAALILAQHNQLRSRVAMGQEGLGAPGPQPQAANMRLMEWDDELALVAQSHADQCIFEHECSDCRRVSRFGVGQNLFISFQSNFDTRIQWGRAIKAWYDEVAEFSPAAIQPFQFSTPVGHYTQMMWWSSFKIGCGYTMYQEDGWWKKLYTCNYGPGGNIIFSEMYRRGSPCSACPAGTTCSLQYPGLCGSGSTDNSITPSTAVTARPSRPQTTASFPVNNDNNIEDNGIPIIPNNDDRFDGFSGINVINSINQEDVDINALINFFNNRRRLITRRPGSNSIRGSRRPTALVTARPTTPSTTTTTPSPPSTTTSTTQPPVPTTIRFTRPTTTPTTTTTPMPLPTSSKMPTTTRAPVMTKSTVPSTTTTSSPQGPAGVSTFATNQVFQQRTSPAAFRPVSFAQSFAQNQEAEQEFEPAETEFEPAEAEEPQEPQEQEFIPFNGAQPQASDLMPFLRRSGMNTQVIRTTSLANVQNIINSLPAGLRPIVLFRSGSGHLTELNSQTLIPIRRFGRSTTTRLPNKEPSVLLTCDLDVSPCNIKPVGGVWSKGNTEAEGNFNQVELGAGEGSQVVVQELVSAPSTDAICVGLSHFRSLAAESAVNGTLPDVQVGVMPLQGDVSRVALKGASGVWEMSRMTFGNITTPFQMVLTMGPSAESSMVAVDALQITDGECCMSGEC